MSRQFILLTIFIALLFSSPALSQWAERSKVHVLFLGISIVFTIVSVFVVHARLTGSSHGLNNDMLKVNRKIFLSDAGISYLDEMAGLDFEHYLGKLLENQGYSTTVTQGSGDLGVDIIATKDGVKYAIQAKRQSGNVSRRAVSDAVAGAMHYKCDKSMVVTNGYFSYGAKALAQSTNCILVDRDLLVKWVNCSQSKPKYD